MNGLAARVRMLPYLLAFFSSLCIMTLELVASRLVARHVGASLDVWTSVIGIMLGGICLGNVLGGRLADRTEPSKALGPIYALASALTLASLWLNAVGGYLPLGMPAWLRTVVLVSIDFLIPGTILGMIGPVVAKLAVENARKAGSAIGDVYFLGAVGSIAGTFLAGYVLMYTSTISGIITIVAAALALLAAGLIGDKLSAGIGVLAGTLLGLGSISPLVGKLPIAGILIDNGTLINPIALAGHVATLALAVVGLVRLNQAKLPPEVPSEESIGSEMPARPRLGDLAALSFLISLGFMAFEMAAGRLVTRHLGSSIFGWTSVIGVLLGGLSIGNFLGGKIADKVQSEKQSSWLFLAASVLLISVLMLEGPPRWLVSNPIGVLFRKQDPAPLFGSTNSILTLAIDQLSAYSWGTRLFLVIAGMFFLPSVALGTVSPVMAKLAIDRVKRTKRTGAAIGMVYAWGMVGSILGTFLTGFLLIDVLGAKGVLLVLATLLALTATVTGTTWHAVWAGIPLGLCVITFTPIDRLRYFGEISGIREPVGDPATTKNDSVAWLDESNYYYIKVENETDDQGLKRTLVLDNLIHGYFILGHPERLDYDYEHIYALVSNRVSRAKAKANAGKATPGALNTMFLGGGAYAFQRYILDQYPGSTVEVAEIDPAVKKANHMALGLDVDTPIVTHLGDARQFVEKNQGRKQFDIVYGDAFNDFSVPWHLTTREFNDKLATMMAPDGIYMINIIDVYQSEAKSDEKAAKSVSKMGSEAPPGMLETETKKEHAMALQNGGFLGAWVKTARLTFPYIYVFGTDNNIGSGLRETFVVVASKTALDIDELGRPGDPAFGTEHNPFRPRPYPKLNMDELEVRSRGIVLTDDYAPVENLLAPVAETRGN